VESEWKRRKLLAFTRPSVDLTSGFITAWFLDHNRTKALVTNGLSARIFKDLTGVRIAAAEGAILATTVTIVRAHTDVVRATRRNRIWPTLLSTARLALRDTGTVRALLAFGTILSRLAAFHA
jgi:hypothetical protein